MKIMKIIYLLIASLLISLTGSTLVYRNKYTSQLHITKEQQLTIASLNESVRIGQVQYQAAILAEQEKQRVLSESEERIETLEKLLAVDQCANTRMPVAVSNRLRDRANSIRNTSTATRKPDR